MASITHTTGIVELKTRLELAIEIPLCSTFCRSYLLTWTRAQSVRRKHRGRQRQQVEWTGKRWMVSITALAFCGSQFSFRSLWPSLWWKSPFFDLSWQTVWWIPCCQVFETWVYSTDAWPLVPHSSPLHLSIKNVVRKKKEPRDFFYPFSAL